MINKYIFFRTDRIGDFLLSAILIKCIKRSDKNSHITVVTSKKNFDYIKKFDFIDKTVLFPSNYFEKILFYFKNFIKKYYFIGVLDGKKRSIYFSVLTRSKLKFLFTKKIVYKFLLHFFFNKIFLDRDFDSKILEIKKLLRLLNFNLVPSDFKTINKNSVLNLEFKMNRDAKFIFPRKFLLLHFDEKWIYDNYIKSFTSIEPQSVFIFISFLEKLILKLELDIIISTGVMNNKIIDSLKKKFLKLKDNIYKKNFLNNKIFLFDKLDIFQLERLIFKCHTIVTCHGAPTHIAGSLDKKIIDIIQLSSDDHLKWTRHLNNYNCIRRNKFSYLSKVILEKLEK
jgi:ADP-heptose:LPS heptosyltransferase